MIDFDREGPVWVATINRPDKANSLTHEMLVALAEFMEDAQAARADLDEARAGLAVSDIWERLSGAIAALPGLSICALNGTLAGGAMGMALACDLRICVPGAKFFYPVMKLGFLPQPSDPARMAALIGPARSKLILMGGQKITAQEALTFGLVDRIVPAEELMQSARDIVADTVAATPEIATGIKAMCAPPETPAEMP
ncbi:enoyl-CoA hydratase/isomerase family protein [Sulfitobacter pontiacus]|uniref:enoyl-CoA hydratase/isomerase family protein n=1 Tax=Sulfitobacter pontiacus TaxID=60137 RepID=UPI0030EB1AE0